MIGTIIVSILCIFVYYTCKDYFEESKIIGAGILILGLVSIFMLIKIFLVFYGIL